jgi:WD40 repeat protein
LATAHHPPPVAAPGRATARLTAHKRCRLGIAEALAVQSLIGACSGVVWVVRVSRDGHFLATAGQDGVLRVWQTSCSR